MRFRIPYYDTSYRIQLKPHVWRYYLDHAPYGDLDGLMLRYRAFNRYLPELFLWHVFDSLATAICKLEFKEPPFSTGIDHVLHLDIKPANILLGYEIAHDDDHIGGFQALQHLLDEMNFKEKAGFPQYPSIKIADFGVSSFSEHDRPVKFNSLRARGTFGFMPPVRNALTSNVLYQQS